MRNLILYWNGLCQFDIFIVSGVFYGDDATAVFAWDDGNRLTAVTSQWEQKRFELFIVCVNRFNIIFIAYLSLWQIHISRLSASFMLFISFELVFTNRKSILHSHFLLSTIFSIKNAFENFSHLVLKYSPFLIIMKLCIGLSGRGRWIFQIILSIISEKCISSPAQPMPASLRTQKNEKIRYAFMPVNCRGKYLTLRRRLCPIFQIDLILSSGICPLDLSNVIMHFGA